VVRVCLACSHLIPIFKSPENPAFEYLAPQAYLSWHSVDNGAQFAAAMLPAVQAMERLTLNDASVVVQRENSDSLGAGFR
jgi:translation elongation factor EF-4